MLERLRDLLRVHRAEIAAELAERAQRRRRAWLIVAAFFSVLALTDRPHRLWRKVFDW